MSKSKLNKIYKYTKLYKIAFEQVKIIKLPGEDVKIGPGTVPTSNTSVSHTSTSEMVSSLRKASRLGIFNNHPAET